MIRSHLFPDVPMTRISPACPRVPGSAHALAAQRFAFEQYDGTDIHWGSDGTHLACAEIGTICPGGSSMMLAQDQSRTDSRNGSTVFSSSDVADQWIPCGMPSK